MFSAQPLVIRSSVIQNGVVLTAVHSVAQPFCCFYIPGLKLETALFSPVNLLRCGVRAMFK